MLCLCQELDVGARHIKLYLNSTLVFEGELEKGCGNQVFDYSTTIDLQDCQVSDSVFSSPVASGHSLRGATPLCYEDSKGGEGSISQRYQSLNALSDTAGQNVVDMQEKSHTPLPPITASVGVSSSTRHSIQRSSFDLSASEETHSLRQQVEQSAPMEQTVTTQPSSSRIAPQWLQPLNRGAPEGCETSRERPRWLVPQHSSELKQPSASSSSMLPELPCNPGRVCRGAERTANGVQWKAESLDLSCDLLEEVGEQRSDRPISGRRSSFRNSTASVRQTEEQHHRATALTNAGMHCQNFHTETERQICIYGYSSLSINLALFHLKKYQGIIGQGRSFHYLISPFKGNRIHWLKIQRNILLETLGE